jgi:hypothetical protein
MRFFASSIAGPMYSDSCWIPLQRSGAFLISMTCSIEVSDSRAIVLVTSARRQVFACVDCAKLVFALVLARVREEGCR